MDLAEFDTPVTDTGKIIVLGVDPESLIREQIDYYRRRAAEYDETQSPPGNPLEAFGKEIERGLHAFKPTGDVLEIASGTGEWARLLLAHASSVTAVDAAPEMHQASRRKLRDDPRVRYVEGDVLSSWEPDQSYDVVFFANWLSHVPPTKSTASGEQSRKRSGLEVKAPGVMSPPASAFLGSPLAARERSEGDERPVFTSSPLGTHLRRGLLDL